MINVKKAKWYCSGDISQIENYAEAVASPERWVCHHRRELDEGLSMEKLLENGLYKKRPASELIFMTESEHKIIHNSGENSPWYGKHFTDEHREKLRQSHRGKHLSEATIEKMCQAQHGENNPMYGKHHTEEARDKMRQKKLGVKWFNNGTENVFTKECPPGFVPGRMKRNK